jgi:hypothetical protein
MRAQEDLQGIFLNVMKGNRKVETLKKTGLPLQIRYMPNKFVAYLDLDGKKEGMDNTTQVYLREKGYKLTPRKYDRKGTVKGYLIDKDSSLTSALAYLDVNLGGLKTARMYAAVEGSGETIDWVPRIKEAAQVDSGNSPVIHEMQSAAKSFLHLMADAMKGTFGSLLLPVGCGIGIGVTIMVILITLSGGKL